MDDRSGESHGKGRKGGEAGGAHIQGYDHAGNLTGDGVWVYDCDPENRLGNHLAAMEYRNRKSILEKPTVYRLGPDAIEMQVEGQSPSNIPYSAVREVHLTFAPSRAQLNRYLADLKTHRGTFRLCSEFFNGPMLFGDQSEEYAAWIRELHLRPGTANPGCRYTGGSHAALWWLYLTGMIVLFAILISLFIVMLVSVPAVAIVKAVILALFVPTLILWFKRNRPTTYGPRDIPPKLLPKISTERSGAGPPPLPRQGTEVES